MKCMVLNDRTKKQGFFTKKTAIEKSKSSAKGCNLFKGTVLLQFLCKISCGVTLHDRS